MFHVERTENNMEILNSCPVCSASETKLFIECKDYTVSQETFKIVECVKCGFKFTNPRPEESRLGDYYKSEEYISHSNTKKGFINSAYQSVRRYTLLKKLQLISKFYKTGKLLDIGCGTGEFLKTFKDAKWDVMGVEPSGDAREMAIENYGLNVGEEAALKELSSESFDVITMWHVLEHVPHLNERIEDLKRLLKPKGIIVVAVPNCSSLDAKKYGAHWAAYDVPRHLYHFTPKDIEALFRKHELTVFRILPMVFDSFYVSMLSEKYRSGKSNLISAVWTGLCSNLSALKSGKTYSSQIYLIRK